MQSEPPTSLVDQAQSALQSGSRDRAMMAALKALAKDSKSADAARIVSNITRHYVLTIDPKWPPKGLINALSFITIDRSMVIATALRYLRATTRLGSILEEGKALGWDAAAKRLLTQPSGLGVLRDPLFIACLQADICWDQKVEALLTAARRTFLLDATFATPPKPRVMRFAVALAQQSALTEYVYPVTPAECAALAPLPPQPDADDRSDKLRDWNLLRRLMFDPNALPSTPPAKSSIPGLAEWLGEVAEDSRVERELAEAIPTVGEAAKDKTSEAVATFYEETPYPKWRSLHLTSQGSRRRYLATFSDPALCTFMDSTFDVWIAGGGTGSQVLDAHAGYGPTAKLFVTDLSRPSLAYAKRSLKAYGIDDIEMALSDILDAPKLGRSFQVIESVGVLHHMTDPFAGWRALKTCLAPGGLMRIGLYSQSARRAINKLRDTYASQGMTGTADEVRQARLDLFKSSDPAHASLTGSKDFYSLWNTRDLLFHVQERPVTLPEIQSFLEVEGLSFLGFEAPPWLQDLFHREVPKDTAWTDLAAWEALERRHWDAFQGMYVFWCRHNS